MAETPKAGVSNPKLVGADKLAGALSRAVDFAVGLRQQDQAHMRQLEQIANQQKFQQAQQNRRLQAQIQLANRNAELRRQENDRAFTRRVTSQAAAAGVDPIFGEDGGLNTEATLKSISNRAALDRQNADNRYFREQKASALKTQLLNARSTLTQAAASGALTPDLEAFLTTQMTSASRELAKLTGTADEFAALERRLASAKGTARLNEEQQKLIDEMIARAEKSREASASTGDGDPLFSFGPNRRVNVNTERLRNILANPAGGRNPIAPFFRDTPPPQLPAGPTAAERENILNLQAVPQTGESTLNFGGQVPPIGSGFGGVTLDASLEAQQREREQRLIEIARKARENRR